MRILVCGGAGYIGSNMTAMLAAEGFEPVVFDNLSTGHISAIQEAELVSGDLADYELIVETLKKYKIEAVMHFAGLIKVPESVEVPLKYYQNNVSYTQNLLSAMEAAGVEKFVFSSSASVYGAPERVPIVEDSPKEPMSPYGQTKWAVERMCHYQSQTGRLRYAALRYFNAAGAGQNCQLGEDHRPESHLIPVVIQAAMGKCSKIELFGTDYPTPDGTTIRDFIHVEDLCRAHMLALNKLEQNSEVVCNIGTGKGYSVREVIKTVKKVSGTDFEVVDGARRPGDVPILVSDVTKAKEGLGWKAKFNELEEIISTAWQWHNKYPNGYPD